MSYLTIYMVLADFFSFLNDVNLIPEYSILVQTGIEECSLLFIMNIKMKMDIFSRQYF